MLHASSYFVGFARLEALLATHHAKRVVYGSTTGLSAPQAARLIDEHWLLAADVQDGVCRYWRLRLAAVPIDGMLRPAGEVITARVASALYALEFVVKNRRLRFEAALMAIPIGLPLVAGDTELIVYDPLADRYWPRAEASVPAQVGEGA